MTGSDFGAMGGRAVGAVAAFAMIIVAVLSIWKAVEIVIWVIKHVTFSIS